MRRQAARARAELLVPKCSQAPGARSWAARSSAVQMSTVPRGHAGERGLEGAVPELRNIPVFRAWRSTLEKASSRASQVGNKSTSQERLACLANGHEPSRAHRRQHVAPLLGVGNLGYPATPCLNDTYLVLFVDLLYVFPSVYSHSYLSVSSNRVVACAAGLSLSSASQESGAA
jgi:hypothetical protein